MPYVRCNGAELYYEDYGDGRPIVLLHGVLHSLRFFEPQLDGLSDDHRAIALASGGTAGPRGRSSGIRSHSTPGTSTPSSRRSSSGTSS